MMLNNLINWYLCGCKYLVTKYVLEWFMEVDGLVKGRLHNYEAIVNMLMNVED